MLGFSCTITLGLFCQMLHSTAHKTEAGALSTHTAVLQIPEKMNVLKSVSGSAV